MNIRLHKNARTTPAIRRELQNQPAAVSNRALAEVYGVTRLTIAKWRNRSTTEDASHRPHTIHATLSPDQEAVMVELRETLLLPLDDLLAVTREFLNPKVSRSGIYRCLRRHKVPSLKTLRDRERLTNKDKPKTFKDYKPGFVHVDVKYLPKMQDERKRTYLFAGIDRATRWVYVEILEDKSAESASGFLKRLIEKAPFYISKVLTDNGKEFTDRFCVTGEREPTGNHLFDKVCSEQKIDHRLIKARRPQTNGMIERFNGRISDVLATTRFDSSLSLKETISGYVDIYNHHIPQKALGHVAPIDAIKLWIEKHPELFKIQADNLTEPDR